jgi:hypothetical protein
MNKEVVKKFVLEVLDECIMDDEICLKVERPTDTISPKDGYVQRKGAGFKVMTLTLKIYDDHIKPVVIPNEVDSVEEISEGHGRSGGDESA